jgi:hypothetical protein
LNQPQGLQLPVFSSYYESPVKLVEATTGGISAWRLSWETGGWQPANSLVDKLLFVGGDDIEELTREEFVQHVEHDRARYLQGSGPIFALYETVKAVEDSAEAEGRPPTDREWALINGIRRKTFVMFEVQLQREGDPGADPSLSEG